MNNCRKAKLHEMENQITDDCWHLTNAPANSTSHCSKNSACQRLHTAAAAFEEEVISRKRKLQFYLSETNILWRSGIPSVGLHTCYHLTLNFQQDLRYFCCCYRNIIWNRYIFLFDYGERSMNRDMVSQWPVEGDSSLYFRKYSIYKLFHSELSHVNDVKSCQLRILFSKTIISSLSYNNAEISEHCNIELFLNIPVNTSFV